MNSNRVRALIYSSIQKIQVRIYSTRDKVKGYSSNTN